MYVPVKYNTIVDLYTILIDRGRTDAEIAATLVAGDVQISKDGGSFTTLTNLPTVSPVGGVQIKISLTATEVQCKVGMVRFKDQTSPPEWEEQVIVFYTYGNASAYDTRDFTTQQDLVNRVWDETLTSVNHNTANSSGQRLRRTYEAKVITYGTAQTGTVGSITLAAGESSVNEFYANAFVTIVSGVGVGQTRTISAYDGSTKVATVSLNWATTPDATSVYLVQAISSSHMSKALSGSITNFSYAPNAIDSTALATTAVEEIADGVWNELRADHTTVGTYGEGAASVQGDVTGKVLGGGASAIVGTGVRSILEDNAISAAKIATDAITSDKIAANAIGASEIADNAITAAKIATDAITSDKIAANAIGASEIADNAITAAKIATDAIDADALSADAITEISTNVADQVWDELRSAHTVVGSFGEGVASIQGDITGKVLGSGVSVIVGTGVQASLQDNAITSTKISTGAITASKFAASAIDANALAADAVNEIVDQVWNELRADHTSVGTFGEGTASVQGDITGKILGGGVGVITGTGVQASLQDGAITAAKFATDAITANAIAANAITSSEIADNAITSSKIAANAIGSSQIANAAITASKFAANAIDANALAADAVDEIVADILVTPANKLLTDASGRITMIPAESMMLDYGQAQTGSINTLRLEAGYPTITDIFKGAVVRIFSGTGAGQVRSIIAFNGTNGDITVDRNWVVNPDNTSLYSVIAVDVFITANKFANAAITSSVIAANAVGNSQIADGAISSTKYAIDAIDSNALAASAATEIAAAILVNSANKLLTNASGHVTLADDSLTAAKIAANAIGSSEIADGAITANKIAANAIGATQIASAAITAAKFATSAIDANALAADAVDEIVADILITPANKLATDTSGYVSLTTAESLILTTGKAQSGGANIIKLAAGYSSVDDIYKGAVIRLYAGTGAGQVRSIISYNGTTGNVTVDRNWTVAPDVTTYYSIIAIDCIISSTDFATGAITANVIAADAIGNLQIADNAISATKIATGTITAAKFAANAIDSNALAASAVDEIVADILVTPTNKLLTDVSGHVTPADGSITSVKIAANAIGASQIAADAIGASELATDAVTEIAIIVADQVWDELRSGHIAVGSFGEGVRVESLNTQAKADVNAEADQALVDYDPPTKTELDTTESNLTSAITVVSNKIGTPISLDSGLATISGMLTKMADDNNGADFDSTYNSLATIVTAGVNIELIANAVWEVQASIHTAADTFGKQLNDSRTLIGTPVALDGGAATLGGMLTKMSDDNGGADFDASIDSLHEFRQRIIPDPFSVTGEVLYFGNVITGTYLDTTTKNSVYYRLTPTGTNPLDLELQFQPGQNTVPVKVRIYGRYQTPTPTAGKWVDVYAYDYNLAIFKKLSSPDNHIFPSTVNTTFTFYLNDNFRNPDSPYDVRLRFTSNDTNIASNLYLDQVVLFANTDVSATMLPYDSARAVWTYKYTDTLSMSELLKFSSVIFTGNIISVTDNKTFLLNKGPTGGAAWNDHALIHQNQTTGEMQCIPILSADAAGNVVLYRNLSIVPLIGDAIAVLNEVNVKALSPSAQLEVGNGVWDTLRASHIVSGSFGQGIASVQGNVTGNVQGNVVGSIGSLATQAKADINAEADQALADYDPPTKAELDAAVSVIRGPDNDTLKTLSDQLDNVTTTVNGISNVTRLSASIPTYMTRPTVGSKAVMVEVALKDSNGFMEDPDGNQLTVQVFDTAGTSYNIYLYKDAAFSQALDLGTGTFTAYRKLVRLATGIYQFFYRIETTSLETELIFKFGWEENTLALYEYRGSQIVDAANDITAILTAVTNIKTQTDKLRFDGANRVEADAEAISASTLAADRVEANITNLNATVSSRSTLTSGDVQTAAASAILITPANKLKTDVSGRIEITGTKNSLDVLQDISVSDILNGTIDVKTLKQTLEVLLAYSQGRIVKTGSNYAYYKQDNVTTLFNLQATPSERTRS